MDRSSEKLEKTPAPARTTRRTRERVSQHHVASIDLRCAPQGLSARDLAKRAGVSASLVYRVRNGEYAATCSLGSLLEAVGLDRSVTGHSLGLEKRAVKAILALTARNDTEGLHEAVTALEQRVAGG